MFVQHILTRRQSTDVIAAYWTVVI